MYSTAPSHILRDQSLLSNMPSKPSCVFHRSALTQVGKVAVGMDAPTDHSHLVNACALTRHQVSQRAYDI